MNSFLFFQLGMAALVVLLAPLQADSLLPLKNSNFEAGKSGWTDDKGSSEVVADAARKGSGGLRVDDGDVVNYVRVISESVSVIPGKNYRLSVAARQNSGHGANAILWFLDEEGELIPAADDQRLLVGPPEDEDTSWREFSVAGVAPANAVSAQVYIQSNRVAVGVIDFDEIRLEQVD
jgi:hypothetical protein